VGADNVSGVLTNGIAKNSGLLPTPADVPLPLRLHAESPWRWDEMSSRSARVRKAVFPAAGMGTRFLPATKSMPKEMLPIVDKPLIQYAVEEVVQSGIQNICIVTGRGKSTIQDHFDLSVELEGLLASRNKKDLLTTVRAVSEMIDISYVRQKEALGLGHAVLKTRSQIGDEPFAVVLPDDIIDAQTPCTKQLLRVFDRLQAPVLALMEVDRDAVSSYGIVYGEHMGDGVYRIRDMVEKPDPEDAPSRLAIIGRYILTADIFDVLAHVSPGHGSEIQLTDALRAFCKNNPLYGLRFSGQRYDAGDKLGFLIANIEFALRREKLGAELESYLRQRMTAQPITA
jgi:UTP--glucose-1-phosphate uridylyltransferase